MPERLCKIRIKALEESISQDEFDAYLVKKPTSIYYFSGFLDSEFSDNFLLIPLEGDPTLFVKEISFEAARRFAKGCSIELVGLQEKMVDKVAKKLAEMNAKVVGLDDISTSTCFSLVKARKDLRFELKPEIVWDLRRVKDEEEIRLLSKAAEIADKGMKAAMESIGEGVLERDIAAEAEYAMRKAGSESFSFDTIVSSGRRSVIPHAGCSDRALRDGDIVIVDIGAVYRGYHSDLTRTFIIGRPSERQSRIYDMVLRAQDAAFEKMRDSALAKEVDKAARDVILKQGYGAYFVHGVGHGIGLDVHEPPYLNPISKDVLRRGNVITIEPAAYIPRFGGIRIEDMALVLEDGVELLTQSEKSIWR